jgi:hypothetical protein
VSRAGSPQPVAAPRLTDVSATTRAARWFFVTGVTSPRWPRRPRHLRPDGGAVLRDAQDHRQPSPVGTHRAIRSRSSSYPGGWPRRDGRIRRRRTWFFRAVAKRLQAVEKGALR